MNNKKSILQSKTSSDEWQKAQEWEERHWVNAQRVRARSGRNILWKILSSFKVVPKYRGDDWNTWWSRQFDDYSFLPKSLDNAIEVGCGPYTNIRMMIDRCNIKHLVLSDPLIKTYRKFKLTFVREMHDKAGCMLDDHPLEELPFRENQFDLGVMINVLDHVKDADKCMHNLYRVMKPGGIVIYGQDLSQEEDAEALLQDKGLVGHPIKLHEEWFKPWIAQCDPIIHKVLSREEGRNDTKHYATLIFAGRVKK